MENENKSTLHEDKEWKPWQKNLLAGAICFTVGLSAPIAIFLNTKHDTKSYQTKRIEELKEENRSLKKQLETQKEKIVTVPVYVTESVSTTQDAAPVTDVPETKKAVTSSVTETKKQISEDEVRALTNPLTKTPPYKVTPPAPAEYTVYWIDASRSDLAGMKADDFDFFAKYINEKYNTDDYVYFYVRLTDIPDMIMEFYIPSYGTMEADIGISKEDTQDHCYRLEYESCVMDYSDPSQIKLTGIKKDEYNLPTYDEDEVYYFSEFNEDMFSQIQKFQEHAKFLWK